MPEPSRSRRLDGRCWVVLLVLCAAVLFIAASAETAVALPEACDRELAAPPSVFLGAWIPAAFDDPRQPRDRDPYGRFEGLVGKQITIVSRWEHWGLDGRIDRGWLSRVTQAGAFPMITWDPWNPDLNPPDLQQGFLLRDIANGAHDRYITEVAREVAQWNGPLFIRFAQEMNGAWYPWGKHQNTPDEYISAWRHVHEIFEWEGAGQVTWVWNVSEKNHPESLSLWYPGDDVVDWVAVDGYNWDDPAYWQRDGNTWRTLDQVFGPSFAEIDRFVPTEMPRMIAETATTERHDDPTRKAAWICDAFRRALPDALRRVDAVMWFQEQKSEADRPFFWPLDTSAASSEAFASAVAPDYYVGGSGDLPARVGRGKIPAPSELLKAGESP